MARTYNVVWPDRPPDEFFIQLVERAYPGGVGCPENVNVYRLWGNYWYLLKWEPWLPWALAGWGVWMVGWTYYNYARARHNVNQARHEMKDLGVVREG